MGAGSGIQGIAAAKKKEVTGVTCADVDGAALAVARKNAEKEGVASKISFIVSDLFGNIDDIFDCIAFNPPYLPGRTGKEGAAALDGGSDGREVTERFLRAFLPHLADGGILLLLQSTLSDSGETEKYLAAHGFTAEKVASRKFFFEEIFVLKAVRRVGAPTQVF